MRAAPAVSVTVAGSAHWRGLLLVFVLVVLASTGAWSAQREDAFGWLVAAAVLAFSGWLLGRAWRRPAAQLRWDGERWWLSLAGWPEALAGELTLALDLGRWLLLRFRPLPRAAGRPRHVWLPLQRAGLQADWHALRCALYSPRPAAAEPAAGDPGR